MAKYSYQKYGNFSPDNKQFIIHNPDTPRPWINYLSNGSYCLLISQTGAGYSYYLDSGENRLTRWSPERYLNDVPGRAIYVRDDETGKYWTEGKRPVDSVNGKYLCEHGLGYTVLRSEVSNIVHEVVRFVPVNDSVDIAIVKLQNKSNKTRRLSVFPFVEWLLGDWTTELAIRNISILLNRGHYDKNMQAVIAEKFPWRGKPWPYLGFIGSSLPALGYDVDYESFFGRYRRYDNPEVVERGKCGNSDDVKGMNMVGALHHRVTLKPGAIKEFSVIVGIQDNKTKANALLKKYRQLHEAKKALEQTRQYWDKAITDRLEVNTPDPDLDRMINVWTKYQMYMNNHWGRSATFYHEGGGEFGYRNTAQDAWGLISVDPEYSKKRLILLAQHQKKNGQPLPGWSMQSGPSSHKPPSDFPIWLPFLLLAYIKETGEFDLLKKKVPFADGTSASLYEHARRATVFLQDMAKSPRGLPLMGTQDWNDAFDRTGIAGKGESVWLGMGLCVALKNMVELANFIGDTKTAQDSEKRYEAMKRIINKIAWDGHYYCYAFNDYGEPIGSKKNKEGTIQLNSQTWAILAGLPDKARLKKILKVIDKDLATPYGPALFKPQYTKYNDRIGRITAFAPGTKENAALFCHGGTFKMASDLMLGRAEEAYQSYKEVLPCFGKDVEIMKTEPYVYPEYYIGLGNNRFGEGAFSWLTGSADWAFVCVTQGILGIRPEFKGLAIDPQIPSKWKQFSVRRKFRGAVYEIQVKNPKGLNRGVKELRLDGKRIEGNCLPDQHDKRKHIVEVILG
ncbi:MAG: hypothetical protein Q8Q33_00490 [Chlamydiota bacterium]|nr:hypothetical protein [Chlamydiota bacterium]